MIFLKLPVRCGKYLICKVIECYGYKRRKENQKGAFQYDNP